MKTEEKYQSLKVKSLMQNLLSDKEIAFLYFYEKNVLKYGLSNEDKSLALEQAIAIFKSIE